MSSAELTRELNQELNDELGVTLSQRQKWLVKYTMMVLIDLVVINLFNQYWQRVYIEHFTISLFAAALLQVLLQLTMLVEHRVAAVFKAMAGFKAKVLRILATWLILFGSKFAILWAINLAFAESVHFAGPLHGMEAFIALVVGIIAAEQVFAWCYRKLG